VVGYVNGEQVGTAHDPLYTRVPYLYSNNKVTRLSEFALSSDPAINNAGQVVGSFSGSFLPPVPDSVFMYSNGKMTNLGEVDTSERHRRASFQ
jgi:probable HAF family extracellular repeat protein